MVHLFEVLHGRYFKFDSNPSLFESHGPWVHRNVGTGSEKDKGSRLGSEDDMGCERLLERQATR